MFGQRTIDHGTGTHYRSERVCAANGQYFFSTREGTLEGPYFNRHYAEREIAFYIRRMIQANQIIDSRSFKTLAHRFKQTSRAHTAHTHMVTMS